MFLLLRLLLLLLLPHVPITFSGETEWLVQWSIAVYLRRSSGVVWEEVITSD